MENPTDSIIIPWNFPVFIYFIVKAKQWVRKRRVWVLKQIKYLYISEKLIFWTWNNSRWEDLSGKRYLKKDLPSLRKAVKVMRSEATTEERNKVRFRCPWCTGYRRWKWTRRHEFNSWTRLIAFDIALIPLGKVWIQLFSLQLWANSRTDWVLQP